MKTYFIYLNHLSDTMYSMLYEQSDDDLDCESCGDTDSLVGVLMQSSEPTDEEMIILNPYG